MNWNQLTSENELEKIKIESNNHPILIFKHSRTCSISATALSRFERNWKDEKAGDLKPYFLDLLSYRAISSKIAEEFGVEHESPQVLVIENGNCVYHESHFGIAFDEVAEKIRQN